MRTFTSLLFIAVALSAHAAAPAQQLLLDASQAGDAIVAVGERGAILRSTDDGREWTMIASPVKAALTGVAFADAKTGWAVGHDGLILKTDDGGASWAVQYSAEDKETSFLDVCALDARRAIAIGAFGLCLATADGGTTWTPRRVLEEDLHLYRISADHDGTLYLAGESGTVLRSRDEGVSWERIATPYEGSFFGVLPLGEGHLLAYGLRGHLYHSTDAGDTWSVVVNNRAALLAAAVRMKSGAIVIAGQARVFLVSHDGGRTVAPLAMPLTTAVAELLETPDGGLLAFGEAGVTRLQIPGTRP